jgi:hypothetical protein
MVRLSSNVKEEVLVIKQTNIRQRVRDKFNEWADKIKSTLKKNENIDLGSQCKMLIDWGRKLKSSDPSYYSQYAVGLEKRLLKESIERLDLNCHHTLEMASKHSLNTVIRKKKIISVVYFIIHYVFPIARNLDVKASQLKSVSLIKKYINEMADQLDKLDDEQLKAILRLNDEGREIGAGFDENKMMIFQRELIGRITSRSVLEDLEKGESQMIEFKSQFPKDATELAEVIASFATSDGGRIFLGVEDDGKVSGLNMQDLARDDINNRISNLAHQSIDPPVKVSVDFFQAGSAIFALIEVPKGSEPVYFVNGCPYIRVLASTRKATASQVKELHEHYFDRKKLTP